MEAWIRRSSGRHQRSFCARGAIERGSDRRFSVAETAALGEGVRHDTEVEGHPRQVTCGAELRNGSLEVIDSVGRSVALRACQRSAIEHGDRTPDDDAVPPDLVIEHRDVAATLLVTPAPIRRPGRRNERALLSDR